MGTVALLRTDVSVRLELPFPPKELSPNARVHYMKKAKVVADYREECAWEAMVRQHDHGRPVAPPVRAAVTFVVPTRHKRDLDNLLASLKPAWDGLVDAGVLAGDDAERFSVGESKIEVGGALASYVVVELEGA
jgi:crossover junction endodeoxyribonuclease RusA